MPNRIVIFIDGEDYEKRMKAARARAEWELGDSSWAGLIVGAFLWPEGDSAALEREMEWEMEA